MVYVQQEHKLETLAENMLGGEGGHIPNARLSTQIPYLELYVLVLQKQLYNV